MFVSDERVPVTLDGQNIIYIRAKMDVGTKGRVQDGLIAAGFGNNGATSIGLKVGSYNTVLLENNIVAWEGPLFEQSGQKIPCTPYNIRRLDPDAPLIDAVLEEISRRNPQKTSGNPKSPAPAGSMSGGGPNTTAG